MNASKARKLRKELNYYPGLARVYVQVPSSNPKKRPHLVNDTNSPRAKYLKAKKELQ